MALSAGGIALTACGSSTDNATSTNAAAGSGSASAAGSAGVGTVGDNSQLVGSFQLKLAPASDLGEGTTTLVGKVFDGPTPLTTVWENPQVDGPCTLTTPRIPFCNVACGGSSACVEDDVCQAYPTAHGVGTVTVSGVSTLDGKATFTMMPVANNYQPSVSLAYPPFAEGAPVTVAAAGDFFPAFSLASAGIAPLVLTSTELALKDGQELGLTWVKSAAGSSTVHVKLDISHHGGSKGQIECDADDTGSLKVSASLISKLLGLGVAGYPTVIVTRRAVGGATISAGRVELVVSSEVERTVSVDGLNSCTKTEDCPAGETCRSDFTCK
jgi:hypothetical protein